MSKKKKLLLFFIGLIGLMFFASINQLVYAEDELPWTWDECDPPSWEPLNCIPMPCEVLERELSCLVDHGMDEELAQRGLSRELHWESIFNLGYTTPELAEYLFRTMFANVTIADPETIIFDLRFVNPYEEDIELSLDDLEATVQEQVGEIHGIDIIYSRNIETRERYFVLGEDDNRPYLLSLGCEVIQTHFEQRELIHISVAEQGQYSIACSALLTRIDWDGSFYGWGGDIPPSIVLIERGEHPIRLRRDLKTAIEQILDPGDFAIWARYTKEGWRYIAEHFVERSRESTDRVNSRTGFSFLRELHGISTRNLRNEEENQYEP